MNLSSYKRVNRNFTTYTGMFDSSLIRDSAEQAIALRKYGEERGDDAAWCRLVIAKNGTTLFLPGIFDPNLDGGKYEDLSILSDPEVDRGKFDAIKRISEIAMTEHPLISQRFAKPHSPNILFMPPGTSTKWHRDGEGAPEPVRSAFYNQLVICLAGTALIEAKGRLFGKRTEYSRTLGPGDGVGIENEMPCDKRPLHCVTNTGDTTRISLRITGY